jgi:hypothetical protein
MLMDAAERCIVSSIGFLDHGSLVVWDTVTGSRTVLPVDDSQHLRLHGGEDDYFAVSHHHDGHFHVTARHFSQPDTVLGTLWFPELLTAELDGDPAVWERLPHLYGGRDSRAGEVDDIVVRVRLGGARCEAQLMDWRSEYDLMYQGMRNPVDARRDELVLIPVQRSARVVIYDWAAQAVVGHIPLPGGYSGNPTLRWRTPTELWADNYWSLAAISGNDWSVRIDRRLEPSRAFIGSWSFSQDLTTVTVARPRSGDVLALNCATLESVARVDLGGEPLEAIALSNGRVFARDWKSGDPLTGRLRDS